MADEKEGAPQTSRHVAPLLSRNASTTAYNVNTATTINTTTNQQQQQQQQEPQPQPQQTARSILLHRLVLPYLFCY
ncbi:MAG: hypothetical protein AAFX79_13775 [Planctomycetota bacterium]